MFIWILIVSLEIVVIIYNSWSSVWTLLGRSWFCLPHTFTWKIEFIPKKMPLAEKVTEITIWLTSSQAFIKEIANLFKTTIFEVSCTSHCTDHVVQTNFLNIDMTCIFKCRILLTFMWSMPYKLIRCLP